MLGSPASPEREQKARFAAIAKLPELRKRVAALERLLNRTPASRRPAAAAQAA